MKMHSPNAGSNKSFRWLILFLLESIFLLPATFAQNSPVDTEIRNAFDQYRGQYVQEKIYVHTDKNSYVSGEICWFRLYDLDASFHKPVSFSKIAYVEVLDKNNQPVIQEKVSLKPERPMDPSWFPLILRRAPISSGPIPTG